MAERDGSMTKRELIDYCLTYPAAYEDYPFDETAAVIKHSAFAAAGLALHGRGDDKKQTGTKSGDLAITGTLA